MRIDVAGWVGAALLLVAGAARAEPPPLTYSIEEGMDKAHVYLAWPRNCGADGAPLGKVNLALNPEWVARQHDVDYEVVEQGKRYTVPSYCAATTRIHVLLAKDFPTTPRVAKGDDISIGHKPGETFLVVPAIDAIELGKRPAFFESDPRQTTLALRFDAPRIPDDTKALHLELALSDPTTLDTKRALYTQIPGTEPSAAPSASASAAPSASVALTPAPAAEPPAKDGRSRWVYAAAIFGLFAGGFIAYRQKKQKSPP